MGSQGSENDMVISQVSVGGFNHSVTAKMLLEYFEEKIGKVWRCRLKTSSTPRDTYPNFKVNTWNVRRVDEYEKVEPHAFVHFADPKSVTSVLNAAGLGELTLDKNPLKISLGPENPYRMNQRRRTTMPIKLSDVIVEIGLLCSQDKFFVGWRGPSSGVDFLVDPFDGTCKLVFTKDVAFAFKGTANHAVISCNFKVEFPVMDIFDIKEYPHLVMLLRLTSSPSIYYRTADDDIEETVSFDLLDDDDPWIRTTDFTPSGSIGRCNTYRISMQPRNGPNLLKAVDYFKKQRVKVKKETHLLKIKDEYDFGMPMRDPFFCIQDKERIPFKILFLVNVLLHKCTINQHQLSDEFYNLLRNQSEEVSIAALEHICTYRYPLYNAFGQVKRVQEWLLKNPNLIVEDIPRELNDIVQVRGLIITPSKAYCLPPVAELSNRVFRNYREVADRFLRVTFMDEGMKKIKSSVLTYYPTRIVKDITSNYKSQQKTAVSRRVRNILCKGFYLCGRKYSFLAFSCNQLRASSAWFFADDRKICCQDILHWMGKFRNKNVAKCAARMGQCFSSTYATVEVPRKVVDMNYPDITRNDYVFSDGIGKISPDLAMEVAERLQLKENPPCAYQIRYAGCKGVVACWPTKGDGIKLSLRPSMNKFESNHTVLEICSWTKMQPGFLNREIITLLSALDVKDDIFWNMQKTMVSKLNQMVEDTDVAFDVLTASCADQGNTAALMLSAGFKPQTEPHLRGMLSSVRAAQFEDLREKARIFVPNGRWLMGCLDELGILEQGQCFIQVSKATLEDCFVKPGSRFSHTKKNLEVIKGLVVIAKNPCLHPGDVRILEAVHIPELDHLHDCLIFPQNGYRPHTDEASGSDLDGDIYFVTWDEHLIPPSKTSWPPMEYTPAEVKQLEREVQHGDIIDFFNDNLVNDSLGTICHAHVVHADLSVDGALDEKCIELAKLAATAVDFPKTGKIVQMPSKLKPKLYPDFMGKEEFQTYESTKLLGKLYRQIKDFYDPDVESSSEEKIIPGNIPYDNDLEISGSESFVTDAWNVKCSYDRQLNGLIGQYKLKREEEIVTGHIWSMGKNSSKKKGELKERIRHCYSALRKEFRKEFENLGSDFDHLSDEEKNIIYEKKASAWYQVTYHSSWVKKSMQMQDPDGKGKTIILSFAWIAADYLARLKIKRRGGGDVEHNKPINSLAKFLADRLQLLWLVFEPFWLHRRYAIVPGSNAKKRSIYQLPRMLVSI